ncbi:MAG: glycosyltransferase family 2 protein [Candidatus Omnitrophica bacterium]|nr:glycosyltransferase family 2 protein [Candidatus Omnitrophota bacterium]
MKTFPRVAIVLINWNGFDDTSACIESLSEMDYPEYSIIVVDNASGCDDAARLKEKYPFINVLRNTINRGFAGGNNDGIKWAIANGFEFIWVLNNDTVVEKGSLRSQMKRMFDPEVGAVGSKIKIYSTDLIWSEGVDLIKITLFPPHAGFFSNSGEGRRDDGMPAMHREVSYISGCSILLRGRMKNIFFDERYFAYCEDMDLSRRIREEGYKLVYEPGSVVYHKVSKSTGGKKFGKTAAYYTYRNKLLFLKDACPRWKSILLLPFYFLCMLRDLWRIIFFYDGKADLFSAVFRGASDGIGYFISPASASKWRSVKVGPK